MKLIKATLSACVFSCALASGLANASPNTCAEGVCAYSDSDHNNNNGYGDFVLYLNGQPVKTYAYYNSPPNPPTVAKSAMLSKLTADAQQLQNAGVCVYLGLTD